MSREPLDRLLRPAAPPPGLRDRVLSGARAAALEAELAAIESSRRGRRLELAWRVATALALLGHLWVSFASERFQAALQDRFATASFHSYSLLPELEAER